MSVKGKYELGERLGGGGMAEVFAATTIGHEGFSRPVAIKRILPGYSANPDFATMFVAEAQMSAHLAHPNIVSTLDFDRADDGALFLVMELVSGVDLDTLAKSGRLPFSVVIHVIAEVLRGLGFAHNVRLGDDSRGIVHRDVSPHNILLSWEGAVKVSDFGLAKVRAHGNASASELLKGKPAYMSPEQANSQTLDGRSDLFSVGIILWELLVGRRLFSADDTRATFAALFFSTIPRPQTLRPDVPRDLERVVMKLLEREPADRYATAEAALVDLLACGAATGARDSLMSLLHEQFRAIGPSQGYRFVASDHIAKNAQTSFPTLSRTRRSRRRWLLIAMGVGLVAAAGGIYQCAVLDGADKKTTSEQLKRGAHTDILPLGAEQLPPGCVQLMSILEHLSHCNSESAEWRSAFAGALVTLKEKLRDMTIEPALQNEGCLMSSKWAEPKLRACNDPSLPVPTPITPDTDDGLKLIDTSGPVETLLPQCAMLISKLKEFAECKAAPDVYHQMYLTEIDGMTKSMLWTKTWGATERSRSTLDHNCKGMLDDLERQRPKGC